MSFPGANSGTGANYLNTGTRMSFSRYAKFFVCSDSQENPTAYCKIKSFSAWYTYDTPYWDYYMAGLSGNFFHKNAF